MGVRLIVEVLDHAPANLTPAERLVLVVIAEAANDRTREGWPGTETLTRRTGLTDRGVRAAFARLATRGLEVRVPIGKDSRGHPVYSKPGHRTVYRLPRLVDGGTPVPPNAGTPVPPSGSEWRNHRSGMAELERRNGGTPVPPFPHEPSENPQQHARGPLDGTTDDERAAVMAEARRRRPDASDRLVRHILREDGPAILAELRAATARAQLADWIAGLAIKPPCPHGQPGGNQRRPDTHEPQCALCRAAHRGDP